MAIAEQPPVREPRPLRWTKAEYYRMGEMGLYARVGIADYWIINLVNHVLEVRRRPTPMPEQPFGFGYADLSLLRAGDTVAPLAAPQAVVAVADLLP